MTLHLERPRKLLGTLHRRLRMALHQLERRHEQLGTLCERPRWLHEQLGWSWRIWEGPETTREVGLWILVEWACCPTG